MVKMEFKTEWALSKTTLTEKVEASIDALWTRMSQESQAFIMIKPLLKLKPSELVERLKLYSHSIISILLHRPDAKYSKATLKKLRISLKRNLRLSNLENSDFPFQTAFALLVEL
jgi:hypothetical protein